MNKTLSVSLKPRQRHLLLLAAAISSSCGLAVELLFGTLASYLVGNQALAYGVAVGGFLAAMGIGSYLTRFIATETKQPDQQQDQLLVAFTKVELAIAPLIAFLPLALFALFVVDGSLWLGLCLATMILGILAGLEVPLLTRILELEEGVREALAGVLALDYAGALLGSLLFPVILLPLVGLFPSAFILGSLPALMIFAIAKTFPQLRWWGYLGLAMATLLLSLAPLAVTLSNALENTLYKAPVISRIQSPYQKIVLTRYGKDLRLFLDGDLQMSTLDEYRYHEALVHPAMSASKHPQRILLMGAGDGMALREIWKWESVTEVIMIELDPAVVKLASSHPQMITINQSAFGDERLQIIYGDAFIKVPQIEGNFEVIIADFPDPDQEILAKLYSEGFYRRLLSKLAPDGILVTQASSPFFAPDVFSCITKTLNQVGLEAHPYVFDVPSFGPWSFVIAAKHHLQPQSWQLPVPTRFLNLKMLQHLFELPEDIQLKDVKINSLSHPVIVRYQSNPRWAAY
ncbi:MAG: polyamine aminopropyltransferase [Moorea sp. SIO2B7]|nr:polyamine aminopropyltransferase [Moorena sp. SIO2B7]